MSFLEAETLQFYINKSIFYKNTFCTLNFPVYSVKIVFLKCNRVIIKFILLVFSPKGRFWKCQKLTSKSIFRPKKWIQSHFPIGQKALNVDLIEVPNKFTINKKDKKGEKV